LRRQNKRTSQQTLLFPSCNKVNCCKRKKKTYQTREILF
jgi:hypothetical protein